MAKSPSIVKFRTPRAQRNSPSYVVLFLLFSLYQLAACADSRASVSVQFVNGDGSKSPKIRSELAVTAGERNLGLMYRKSMPEDHGMLFIFPDEAERSFWMKNTYLELDIIYLDSQFRVVSISPKAVPLSTSARPSNAPARYVLEVGGGLAEKWGVAKGSRLEVFGELPNPS